MCQGCEELSFFGLFSVLTSRLCLWAPHTCVRFQAAATCGCVDEGLVVGGCSELLWLQCPARSLHSAFCHSFSLRLSILLLISLTARKGLLNLLKHTVVAWTHSFSHWPLWTWRTNDSFSFRWFCPFQKSRRCPPIASQGFHQLIPTAFPSRPHFLILCSSLCFELLPDVVLFHWRALTTVMELQSY